MILLLALALASAGPDDKAITEISLERTPCYGTCPVDKVVLRSDGTATYTGLQYVERIGTYEARFSKDDFARLAKLLESQEFFDLKGRYDVAITDHPSVITRATRDGKQKEVVDYANAGPIELWGIEKAIRGVVIDLKWKKKE